MTLCSMHHDARRTYPTSISANQRSGIMWKSTIGDRKACAQREWGAGAPAFGWGAGHCVPFAPRRFRCSRVRAPAAHDVHAGEQRTGCVSSEFRTAGINQTLHRLQMRLTAQIAHRLPGNTLPSRRDTGPVAEHLIGGKVPMPFRRQQRKDMLQLIPKRGRLSPPASDSNGSKRSPASRDRRRGERLPFAALLWWALSTGFAY